VNGDAIYGTRPWVKYGEGPTRIATGSFHDTDTAAFTPEDFRFTTQGNVLYAIELGWPAGGEAVIHSLSSKAGAHGSHPKIAAVALRGYQPPLPFEQRADGLHIQLPAEAPGKYAYAFRIVLSGPPKSNAGK
jgi:alpha-L-fucosidase